jgi:hypothetical protein
MFTRPDNDPISQFPETKSFPGLNIWGCCVDGVVVAEVGHIPSEFSSLPSCNSIDFASVTVKPHHSRTAVLPISNFRTRVYGLTESLLFSVAPWSCRCHYRRPSCPRCLVISVEVKSFPLFLSLYKESFAPLTRIKKTFLPLSFNTIRGSNSIITQLILDIIDPDIILAAAITMPIDQNRRSRGKRWEREKNFQRCGGC